MSDPVNTNWLARAAEVCSYFEGTDLETAIHNNLDRNDLDMVRHLVIEAEAEISRQEFYNHDALLGANDVY